jgi:hypothetical protein
LVTLLLAGPPLPEAARPAQAFMDAASQWYKAGHDYGVLADLWQFRWEHAAAILPRRRSTSLPPKPSSTKTCLGDVKTAVEDRPKASPNDPFYLCLLCQPYEKDKAMECYRKAAASTATIPWPPSPGHSPARN